MASYTDNFQRSYDFAVSQLESRRPFDVTQGIDLLFKLIRQNQNNSELFTVLRQTIDKHPEHLQQIEEELNTLDVNLAKDILKTIRTSLSQSEINEVADPNSELVSGEDSLSTLLEKADDKYYAAEYDQAIRLYQAVLEKDSSNQIAHEQLKKAELLRGQEKISKKLPREAVQFYRRARSYVNAGDVNSAANLLQAALDAVEKEGLVFAEAQELFDSLQDAIAAADFKKEADDALKEKDWKKAVEKLTYALKLDSTDSVTKKLLEQIESLRSVYEQVNMLERAPGGLLEQREKYFLIRKKLENTNSGIATEELYNDLAERVGSAAYKLAEQIIYRAEASFDKAQKASILKVKTENFSEATRYFQDVENIVSTSLLGDLSSQIDTFNDKLRIKGDCENLGELAKQYYESINALKNSGRFPDGVKQSEVEAWRKFAPYDPDVKRAQDYIVEKVKKDEEAQQAEQRSLYRKRVASVGYIAVPFFLMIIILSVTYPWLGKKFQALLPPTPTITLTPTITPLPTFTLTPTPVPPPSETFAPTITPLPTSTPSGIAINLVGGKAAYLEPTIASQVIASIPKNTQLSILDKKIVGPEIWYFCQWQNNGVNREGWISDDYITLVSTAAP